jgi:hypothetical protein
MSLYTQDSSSSEPDTSPDPKKPKIGDKSQVGRLLHSNSLQTILEHSEDGILFYNPILFAVCTHTFSKLCRYVYSGM